MLAQVRAVRDGTLAIRKCITDSQNLAPGEAKQRRLEAAPSYQYLKDRAERDEELPDVEVLLMDEEKGKSDEEQSYDSAVYREEERRAVAEHVVQELKVGCGCVGVGRGGDLAIHDVTAPANQAIGGLRARGRSPPPQKPTCSYTLSSSSSSSWSSFCFIHRPPSFSLSCWRS